MRSGYPQSRQQRRPKAAASSIATNFVHLRNPFVVAWMSASFPGFGHVSLGNYVIGFLLFGWEMLVNTQASLNIGIIYSVTGRYEMAKEIVNNRWLLFYAPVWVFAIWSSYRLTVYPCKRRPPLGRFLLRVLPENTGILWQEKER